jgi:hypothetical protein
MSQPDASKRITAAVHLNPLQRFTFLICPRHAEIEKTPTPPWVYFKAFKQPKETQLCVYNVAFC